MPFTLYCYENTPADASNHLLCSGATLDGDDDEWSALVVIPGGLFRRKKTLAVHYDRQRHASPGWQMQLQGMQNYISMFEMNDARVLPGVKHLISLFRFELGIVAEPEIEKSDDPRLAVIHTLADQLNAVIFTPGALLDAQFRPFVSADGDTHPDALIPSVCAEAPPLSRSAASAELDDYEVEPPTADRVARRMYALLAIIGRALLDINLADGRQPAYDVNDLRAWLAALDIDDAVEPQERQVIDKAAGQLTQREAIDGVWALEGLVVLAWTLGLAELPPYDQLVETDELMTALAFLDHDKARAIIANASLRPEDDLERCNAQLFAYHWRMVDYRTNGTATDYARVQFGPEPLDVSWAQLIDGDLALQGVAITKAEPQLIQTMWSASMERYRASNWLRGHSYLYSQTRVDT